jgi:hypothetical protein
MATELILHQVNERTGPVTVHFSRFGYTVRPVSS